MGHCVTAIHLAVNFSSIHVLNTLNKPCQVEDGDTHEDDDDMSLTWVWLGCAGGGGVTAVVTVTVSAVTMISDRSHGAAAPSVPSGHRGNGRRQGGRWTLSLLLTHVSQA